MNVIQQEFNSLASEYETNRLSSWYKAHAVEVFHALPPNLDGRLLDVGCGTGYLLREVLKRHPRAHGIGLDLAPAMVEQAGRLASAEGVENVRFVNADWENFDVSTLGRESVDAVICANAFHYFSNPQAAILKFRDVLAPGGALYLLERNKSSSPLTLLWGWLHRHVIKDHVEFYRLDQIVSMLGSAGFLEVRVTRNIQRLMWMNKLYTSIALIQCIK